MSYKKYLCVVANKLYGDYCNMTVPCDVTRGLFCSYFGYNILTGGFVQPGCNCPNKLAVNQCDW